MNNKLQRRTAYFILSIFMISVQSALAQKMPREDVVDIPAVGEGLCVSNLFQTNMVLQRDKPIHVWGWAEPGEEVTVNFAGESTTTLADKDRSWKATLAEMPANSNPQEMTIRGKSDTLVLDNLLVGDVWVLGGQSNMEFELAKVENGALEIVSANFPLIRILSVPHAQGPEEHRGFARLHQWSDWSGRHFRKGDWDVCTPEIARELSAIGYVFARRIHMASSVPIGVIDVSRGGTTVEAWTPLQTLRSLESEFTQAKLAEFDTKVAQWNAQDDLNKRVEQHHRWLEKQRSEGNQIPSDRLQDPNDLRPGPIADANYPGNCFAGMIYPLAGLSIKGAIFHQGFNNAFDGSTGAQMYREVFPEMIKAWRTTFNAPDLPFGILSLCTAGDTQTHENYCEMMFDAGIHIRAAQYETFLEMYRAGDDQVGFASTYDLRRRWYHPQLKLPAGERIARWALATQYGFDRQLQWKPPMLEGMEATGKELRLTLDTEVGDPQEGEIQGFAIAGEDRKFHPANVSYAVKGQDDRGRTKFDRRELVLTSPMVSVPTQFRYAWGRNPLANLQAVGNLDLPFATQRSDDWTMEFVPIGVLPEDTELPITRSDRTKIIQALREQDKLRRIEEAKAVLESNQE